MKWIYEHKNWPHFKWDDVKLAPLLREAHHKQAYFLGRMSAIGFQLQQEASLETLTQDVVKSSAIEGEVLNPEEVRSSIATRLGLEYAGNQPANRDVEGVVEVLLDATQNYEAALTDTRLFGWHAALFPTGYAGMHKITVANWRSESSGAMQVISGPMGREKIHYEAPAASLVPAQMHALLTHFNKQTEMDPIIKAGLFHLWFVTIHPFEDGNGRIARALADMLLSRADQTSYRFYSMSKQIEAERKSYYLELEAQQRGSLDITPWLSWFLQCLIRAIDGAEETLQSVLAKSHFWQAIDQTQINARQQLILKRLLEGFEGPLNTSKYAKLAKCSTDTALRDIQALVHLGALRKNEAGGRSTSYILQHPK